MATPPLTPTIEARFWGRVIRTDTCWEWDRPGVSGYGQFQIDRRPWVAHRVSYAIAHGPIPDGGWVLHHCNNKRCVRPDHLYLGTPADNIADRELTRPDLRRGYLCLTEAARALGITPDTLRQQIIRGRLKGRKYFEWHVTEREVERYRAESLGRRLKS